MNLPAIPENAPFSAEQRLWLNGFLAGLFNVQNNQAAKAQTPDLGKLLFLYGTQTGGSEMLARTFAKDAKKQGFTTTVLGMEDYSQVDFSSESRLIIITSTYGEGDMPDNAQDFWDHLQSDDAPDLSHIEFSVLALGDTNYTLFCEAGKNFDARLEALGAKRVCDRVDCDVDYEDAAAEWFKNASTALGGGENSSGAAENSDSDSDQPAYGKKNPFPAKLVTNRKLNGDASAKDTRHIEINLEGSGIEYSVGDALGVMPRNCPELVDRILKSAGITDNPSLSEELITTYDLKPFLTELPNEGTSQEELVDGLKKLQPRLYSISSSPKAHPGEVHLTVGVVTYELDGQACKGVCSTYLAEHESRAGEDGSVGVFIHNSPNFRLPEDTSKPVIMVGPGTGIAPFRAFLEERKATQSPGKNWLFFGDQTQANDFLYQEELEAMLEDGILSRLDLAFSRDQEEKIYVQHLMLKHADELWSWLENGASFYVCGDASRMAKDVDNALTQIVETAGQLSTEEAADYIAQLKREKRYLRDVY